MVQGDLIKEHGFLEIDVGLENDAQVVADNGTLTLSGDSKSGDGYWAAEGSGKLQVDVAVSGGATWKLTDDMDAEIEFNHNIGWPNYPTGELIIQKGTLDLNATIQTNGGLLTFESVDGYNPRIEVAHWKAAYFFD